MTKILKTISSKSLKKAVLEGRIFIYPTDTIYGIGCNALDARAVEKIREIKARDTRPFSIIAPDFEWISNNLQLDVPIEKYLPGPYTLILKKKDQDFLSHVSSTDSLGVRIPKNKFTDKLRETQVPFITTSVNLSGQTPATSISEIPSEIISKVDFVIESRELLSGKPSTLVINGEELVR
jgi:L-threonylcarbamoyladenylate synthase